MKRHLKMRNGSTVSFEPVPIEVRKVMLLGLCACRFVNDSKSWFMIVDDFGDLVRFDKGQMVVSMKD